MSAKIQGTLQAFNQGALIFLFELDVTPLGGQLYRFHDGTNQLRQSVFWGGNEYIPYPIKAEAFDYDPQQPSAPKMTVANVTSDISALLRNYQELAQVKVTRRTTKVQYLDAVNFGRFNHLYWSEDLTNAAWAKANATSAGAGSVTVDGTSYNMNWLTANPGGSPGVCEAAQSLTPSQELLGQVVTLAFIAYAEPSAPIHTINLTARSTPDNVTYTHVFDSALDVSSGNTVTGDGVARYIGNNYWLCSKTFTVPTDSATLVIAAQLADAAGNPVLPTTANGRLQLTRLTLSEGSSADTYQRTTSSWNPTADASQELMKEVYFIARKLMENPVQVQFELAPITDLRNVLLPFSQVMQNSCRFQYRKDGCGYTGGPVADAYDNATSDPTLDDCSRTLQGCKKRPRSNGVYPFGGFPGAGVAQGY